MYLTDKEFMGRLSMGTFNGDYIILKYIDGDTSFATLVLYLVL